LALAVFLSWPVQEGDPDFGAHVESPAYASEGPRVLFDEAHFNVHKAGGRYRPFADLLRNDGYVLIPNRRPFTTESLRGHDVLVIANALGLRGALQHAANLLRLEGRVHLGGDAFSEGERRAVRDWVEAGGSLLLIADHAPAGESAGALAEEFGVRMSDRYAEDPRAHDPESDSWSLLVFSRENGLLLDHPITLGRGKAERLRRVMTFTGQSLTAPPGAVPFLRLSSTAVEYPGRRSPDDAFARPLGDAQGVALESGRGRVVMLGEAAALTSQVIHHGGRSYPFGMGRKDCDNRQLALNIMHWLSWAPEAATRTD
jgi:hypothetical protein